MTSPGTAPSELAVALSRALGREVTGIAWIPGGDLNDAYAATLAGDNTRVFVKTSPDAAPGAFAAEAEGLRWLAEPDALRLPEVLAVADDPDLRSSGGPMDTQTTTHPPGVRSAPLADRHGPPRVDRPAPAADAVPGPAAARPAPSAAPHFLALAWIDAGPSTPASDEALGRGLARLHAAGAPAFGGPDDRWRIGPIALPNEPAADWPSFYATRRIEPLVKVAADRGALTHATPALLDRVLARLPELAGPPEPPARVHGDLWGGNVLVDGAGRPWLIDPAAHGGHRELDLAMLRLFGGPGERCFAAYAEVAPLAPGAAERIPLWQLAPLLLHAALFGASYAGRVEAALRAYA